MNQIKYDIKKLKLKRLIPYYKKLKTEAVKEQRYDDAVKYRDLEINYMVELTLLMINKKLG